MSNLPTSIYDLVSKEDLQTHLAKEASGRSLIFEEFVEGAEREIQQLKQAELEKEAAYLEYLQKKLTKISKESRNPLSEERIKEITKSAESFNKAAQEEALQVWNGMLEELRKSGANESFVEGMQKEAASVADVLRGIATPFRLFGRGIKRGLGVKPKPKAPSAAPAPASPNPPLPP
jgi:hypothetical protein